MPMDDLEKTKRRLIREVIQQNIEGAPAAKPRRAAGRERAPAVWLLGALFVAILLYLSLPSQVASTGMAAPPAAREESAPPRESRVEEARSADTPRSAPRALDRTVLPLAVKRVVLDAGHGGRQHGAISDSGVSEKDITLDIARRLRGLMEPAGFDVVMTRDADETISLQERVTLANASNADLFVSVHVNWLPGREVRPLETYYVGPTDDPAIVRLASVENQESGYSLADYRRLLERLYMDTRRDESYALASRINAELYRALSPIKPRLRNRGVKTAPFVVLIGTEMPAILVEVSSLSNAEDVELLTGGDYRQTIARALLTGIRSYADRVGGLSRKGG